MSSSEYVVSVTDRSFDQTIIEESHDRPVVVDFWAPWCGPCQTLGPVLEELAEEGGGDWVLAKVNVDDNQNAARNYGVRGIPAVKAFVDGEIVDEFTGAQPRANIARWLDGIVPSESARDLDAAWQALEEGDLTTARRKFEASLADEDRNIPARVGMARVLLQNGDVEGAEDMLEAIPEGLESEAPGRFEQTWLDIEAAQARDPDALHDVLAEEPEDLQARFELAVDHAAEQRWETAFELLIDIVTRDREWRDDLGREAIVRLFEIVDDEELVRKWRRKLGQAMYV